MPEPTHPLDLHLRGFAVKAPQKDGPRRYLLEAYKGDEFTLTIDNSSTSDFNRCDKLAEYELVNGRTSKGSSALSYGSALHRGLELFYKGERDLPTILANAESVLNERPPLPLEWRNSEHLRNALTKYVDKYREETFEVYSHESRPLVEVPFREPLCTINVEKFLAFEYKDLVSGDIRNGNLFASKIHVIWSGVIDLIIRDAGKLYIVDHKTTSMEGDSFWKQFELSQQFEGYVWAAQRIINEPIAGALANVVYGKEPAKTEATRKEHEKKMFMRRFFFYRPDQIEEWEENMKTIMSDLVHRLLTGHFPQKLTACVGKYGTCPFHDVCSQPPANRESILMSDMYDVNVWNPLA